MSGYDILCTQSEVKIRYIREFTKRQRCASQTNSLITIVVVFVFVFVVVVVIIMIIIIIIMIITIVVIAAAVAVLSNGNNINSSSNSRSSQRLRTSFLPGEPFLPPDDYRWFRFATQLNGSGAYSF
ncbi:uncharacterized protein LOC118507801 [Anopheles stephensi]|uniref:uncharacterized protein LOC118507801 n=1 Tax=Anopheles stephensi TaxID=30069 RepID=UPI001658BE97|nr:uncharacterized protein LOC118507801 [Anopheles stephensi]